MHKINSDEKRWGAKLHGKGKKEEIKSREYLINISESLIHGYLFILISQGMGTSHQVDKDNSEGDKCPVMTMQIYCRTLVYFGGRTHSFRGLFTHFSSGMAITLYVEKILERGFSI